MNKSNYIAQNWEKILLIFTVFLAVVSAGWMVVALYKTSNGVELFSANPDIKKIPQVVLQSEYEGLVKSLSEFYNPVNMHKRNIFSKMPGEAVNDKVKIKQSSDIDFNNMRQRLRITKIYRKPVKLLFKGYIQLADGIYVATINWGEKTDFKKVGDEIRGYKILDFKKDIAEKETIWGGTEKVDNSQIVLQNSQGDKVVLYIGKIILEKEIYAEIVDLKDERAHEVYIGGDIIGNKILDISPTQVIINTQNGEKINLLKES